MEVVFVFLSLDLCLQSQEEVCDLLHAAPFQNILPRVYIKGKKPRTAANLNLNFLSMYSQ